MRQAWRHNATFPHRGFVPCGFRTPATVHLASACMAGIRNLQFAGLKSDTVSGFRECQFASYCARNNNSATRRCQISR